jgi:hypothetical protein
LIGLCGRIYKFRGRDIMSTSNNVNPVFGSIGVVGGVAALPNTGDNKIYIAVSIFSIVVGVLILLSTGVRFAVKKYTKA